MCFFVGGNHVLIKISITPFKELEYYKYQDVTEARLKNPNL